MQTIFVTNVSNGEEPLPLPTMDFSFKEKFEPDHDDGSNILREVGTGKETPLDLPGWKWGTKDED